MRESCTSAKTSFSGRPCQVCAEGAALEALQRHTGAAAHITPHYDAIICRRRKCLHAYAQRASSSRARPPAAAGRRSAHGRLCRRNAAGAVQVKIRR